jgi:hypothetical protein
LIIAIATVGCGKDRGTVPVSGVARVADGRPLPQGRIMLSGGANGPSGEIGSDGTFRLGTFTTTDGALPGHYKVVIVGASEPDRRTYEEQLRDSKTVAVSLIHPKYGRPETTDLEVDITNGTNDLTLVLDPPSPPLK